MEKLSWLLLLIVIVILLTMNCSAGSTISDDGLSRVCQGQVNDRFLVTKQCIITGTITDEKLKPLSGAVIRLWKDSRPIKMEISDSNGKYKFDTEPGTYTLKVARFNYKSQGKKAIVTMNQILIVNFILKSHS